MGFALTLGGIISCGNPVIFVKLQQLIPRWRGRYAHLKEIFGTEVHRGAKTEIPFFLCLQAVDILQLVKKGTGLVKRNLRETKRSNGCLLLAFFPKNRRLCKNY